MATYRHIQTSFWQDDFILDLEPEEKYFYIYLMTNSKTTQCGIYELSKKVIQFETGYDMETIDRLINKFVEYEKILYSEETNEIMLINWMKHNASKSPKVVSKIEQEIKNVKNYTLLDKFLSICKDLGYPIDTVSIEYPKTMDTETQKKEKENKNKNKKYSRKPKVYDEDSVYFQLAKLLFDKILENNPDHKRPNLQKWADDVRLMMERDNRTEEQIRYLIEWAQNDSFWKRNILSIAKLREKFDQLTLIVKEEKAKKIRPFPKKSELDQLPSYYQPIDVNHWRNEC